MTKLGKVLEAFLDNFKIKKKLQILYVVCMLIPLILTDSIVLYIVIHTEQVEHEYEMQNIASAVQYSFINNIDNTANTAKSIYMNKYIDEFLEKEYENDLDYVVSYQSFLRNTLFESGLGIDSTLVTLYSDNDTIVKGAELDHISSIQDMEWYKILKETEGGQLLYFFYDDTKSPAVEAKRKIVFARELNFFRSDKEKLVKLELDYSKMVRNIVGMNYNAPIYICQDGKILLSNSGHTSVGKDFEEFTHMKEVGFEKDMNLYGQELKIYVLETKVTGITEIFKNMPLILVLLLFNIILPLIFVHGINYSFTGRLKELSTVFDRVDEEHMVEIEKPRGKDEIGSLMRNYNKMAQKTNELIQTVYKDKLREQEITVARQNAELLALHSQINPHFMFNALESIRMHSILRNEYETADMVEKLALMERQNVEWGNDFVEIAREMEFITAYLGLQKYRFGDRISYELEVEEACKTIRIPKLTVVTFVENACVHGIESKTTPGWIFVRVYMEAGDLCLEVEDTGNGMDEAFEAELQDKMENASMEKLQEKGRVGIVNACLRLKIMTEGKVRFKLDSEKGMGTTVQIWIPKEYL